jgi:hypothetical protein
LKKDLDAKNKENEMLLSVVTELKAKLKLQNDKDNEKEMKKEKDRRFIPYIPYVVDTTTETK